MNPTTERTLSEDVLKHIYHCEQHGRRPTLESIGGVLQITPNAVSALIAKMASRRLIMLTGNELCLSDAGQEYAVQIIRAHRLWERYLADETGFAEAEWHEQAEQQEHRLTPAEIDALSARLGHPTHDPHGDPIPTAAGDFVPHGGQPLTLLEPGAVARIVHLEDEPPVVYAQLVAEGLYPGMELHLRECSPQRICFFAGGEEHILAPIVARNISVCPAPTPAPVKATPVRRLSDLPLGETAQIEQISPACRGAERRRLLDLGILPGTVVKNELVSPSGDPTAYLIRQALIALRKEQADLIHIK